MVHLCNAHVSEFLRVFALAYFPSHKSVSTGRIDRGETTVCLSLVSLKTASETGVFEAPNVFSSVYIDINVNFFSIL